MNMIKLNNRLTEKVISFIDTMNAYKGIKLVDGLYRYHRADSIEQLDIDFRLKISYNGLVVSIFKSYDKTTISGGSYTEDTVSEVEIEALTTWLEDNHIYDKEAHKIADRILNNELF